VRPGIRYLDRLRAVAVIGVLVVHTSQFTFANLTESSAAGAAIVTILSAGRLGVEVFFLLSGFLLSYLYEAPEIKKPTRQYFLARFFRIWPLWMVFSLIWSGIYFLSFGEEETDRPELSWILTGIALSAFFLLWLSPSHFESFIGGAWSIQIEVISYIIFALMRGQVLKNIVLVAILINLLGLTLSFTTDLFGTTPLDAIRRLSLQTGFNFFVLGWLFARVYARHTRLHKSESLTISARNVFAGNEVLLTLWLVSFLISPAIYGNTVEAVGFVAISLMFAQISGRFSWLSALLERTGKLSYFMFFMHFVLLYLANLFVPVAERPQTLLFVLGFSFMSFALLYLFCYLFGSVSLRFFEGPLMRFARDRSS